MSDATLAELRSYIDRSDEELLLILGSHEMTSRPEATAALLQWLDPNAEQYAKERGLLPDPPTVDEIREAGRRLRDRLLSLFPSNMKAELCERYRNLGGGDLTDLAPPVVDVVREQLGGGTTSALIIIVATVAILRELDRFCANGDQSGA